MFNMQDMMRQAQAMQEKLQRAQAEAETKTVTVTGPGGLVSITMTGKRVVQSLAIDPSLINPDDRETLEDVVKVTVNQAIAQIDDMIAKTTSEAMGPLAGKFKLPF